MNSELFDAITMLEKTTGISSDYLLDKIETALLTAYKKDTGEQNARVLLDPQKKLLKIFQQREVVDAVDKPSTQISLEDAKKISPRYELGSIVETEINPTDFGRLSAKNGTQILRQAIREAEHNTQAREYESKREDVIAAVVTRTEEVGATIYVDTGTSETVLLGSEQIPGEVFEVGDRIKVFVTEVQRKEPSATGRSRGPLVTLSRTNPGLVKRLFETEIPEISDGIVLVKNVAREAGSRTKIAVYSRDEDVDAVGACIGNHGMRINGIVEELRGEKIDVVKYSENIADYIAAALSPAAINSVIIEGERSAKVYVAPEQLSLAIGKEGQNARLAAKLTGFKIDIKS